MYRLYLDEVGTDTINRVNEDNFRFLSLTGVAIERRNARDFLEPEFHRIKAEIFDYDHDQPICFHRTDIRSSKGPFEILNDANIRAEFDNRILSLMTELDYTVITVLIDKQWMISQEHWEQTHPYHYLMEIMIEKYVHFLSRMNTTGDIFPEARGKKQDRALQSEFERCRLNGTRYVNPIMLTQNIPSSNLKFRTKKDNISGLQLCDLLAHPSHFIIRDSLNHDVNLGEFCRKVSAILMQSKYDRSHTGKVDGYGIKSLP